MTLGQRIRNIMEDCDITQKQMAKDLNLATSTLNGYLCGTRQPDFDMLLSIARYLSVSTDYLLNNTNELHGGENLTEQESEMLRCYRQLDADQRELILEQAKLYIRHSRKKAGKLSRSA